jgi:hypothetical protein
VLIGAEALFAGARSLAASMRVPPGRSSVRPAFANLALFPVFFFFWPFWRAKREPVVASPTDHVRGFGLSAFTGGLRGSAGAGVATFGALILVFGFSPLLLEKHYSVLSLGWSMFAGGEYRDGSYYMLRTPPSACYRYPIVNNMIWIRANEQQIVYLSFRKFDLERLKRFLDRRNCGGTPLQVEAGKF